MDNPAIIPEFRLRYGIEDKQVYTNSLALANEAMQVVSAESVMPKLVCTPNVSDSRHNQFPTTFAVKASHVTSHDMSHDADQAKGHIQTHDSTPTTSGKKSGSKRKQKKSSGSGIFSGKHKSSGNVTLANLASSPIPPDSKELEDSRRNQRSKVDKVHAEEVRKSHPSNESSLSTCE